MKLYEDFAKEPFSFLWKNTTLSSDNQLRYRKTTKIAKNKTTDTKIEQNKTKYNLDRQTIKIIRNS